MSASVESRNVLIVLDDVWAVGDVDWIVGAGGPRCRFVVTTRDSSVANVLASSTRRHGLLPLPPNEATALLQTWAPRRADDDMIRAVAQACGYLPLALALCGAMAADKVRWADILDALHAADLRFIESHYRQLFAALDVSIEFMKANGPRPDYADRYLELGALIGPGQIPAAVAEKLWKHTAGFNARESRKALATLDARNLLRQSVTCAIGSRRWARD